MLSSISFQDSLTRQRAVVAVASLLAVTSLGYVAYHHHTRSHQLPGGGLHRSNAVRHHRRQSQREGAPSPTRSASTSPHPEEPIFATGERPLQPLNDGDTVADGQNDMDDWYYDNAESQQQTPRAGHNIVNLLFRVSEDNSRRNAYVHRGCQCNGCNMVPIRGIRYRCANCVDFDLCESCESQGIHPKTHVFYKIRVPAPPSSVRQMQPVWYTGDPDLNLRSLPKDIIPRLSRETGYERPELEAYWEQWTFLANTEWRDDPDELMLAMDRKTFEQCLVPSSGTRPSAPNLLQDRMFAFYDTNGDGLIGFSEFLHGLAYRKRKDKLSRIFDGYDIDEDGYVDRRDFLRMFRAYYVFFKRMHKDVLEGLEQQMLNSPETQQIVTSRQPLSSMFGREGNIPEMDPNVDRPSGKIYRSTGQVDVGHGQHDAVMETKGDTATRQEILSRLFSNDSPTTGLGRHTPINIDAQYIEALLEPPTSIDALSNLIRDYGITPNPTPTRTNTILTADQEDASDTSVSDESYESDQENMRDRARPGHRDTNHADSTTRRRIDAAGYTSTMPPESSMFARPSIVSRRMGTDRERQQRIFARRQLHERWKRRQFYLDEEEGATPPEGWKTDEDILATLGSIVGNTKAVPSSSREPVASTRSRSSSKVRFVDTEDDDYDDVRSNPSTSSRSVPERWGGMDIPDAERDAGKEILYQIAQQAFNELLDPLFQRKEDLAVRVAETKEEREKYRDMIMSVGQQDDGSTKSPASIRSTHTTGTIDSAEPSPGTASSSSHTITAEKAATPKLGSPVESYPDDLEAQKAEEGHARDPTMPQFMPLSASSTSQGSTPSPTETPKAQSPNDESSVVTPSSTSKKLTRRLVGKKSVSRRSAAPHIKKSTLLKWKKLNMAELEAAERGGFGKLSYEEFEDLYRTQETMGNRLDYLGSWIDFCIP